MAKKFPQLLARLSPERQARIEKETRAALHEIALTDLSRNMSQSGLARNLGARQSEAADCGLVDSAQP